MYIYTSTVLLCIRLYILEKDRGAAMKDLLYVIKKEDHAPEKVTEILKQHPEIKFISLVAVDLGNNHTDEKIPVEIALEDMEHFLKTGAQTDGSSVNLPRIADINNAKVDLIPDADVKWFIDYNDDYTDPITDKPVGTLVIPAFLEHESKYVCSRAVIKNAEAYLDSEVKSLFNTSKSLQDEYGFKGDDIDRVILTTATELEFWVKTPDYKTNYQKLSTSQTLKEQYWKRTVGPVRTALEETVLMLNAYDYDAEMAHKEVGGVPSKLKGGNIYSGIMEQCEVDWKYAEAMQTADNELLARDFISDVFHKHGLEITFQAKPIEGVAGSGEHHHIGMAVKLKNGKISNIFSAQDMKQQYLGSLGWGAFMGLLKNYEVINPFVTSTNDAFNRLKPGFEAPVCIVGSLGHSVEVPSRNRTVLAGLVRDMGSPLATRFELRAPNPTTNTYLATAAVYLGMLDGIKAVVASGKSNGELEAEFSKDAATEGFYLEKGRVYRSEEDVFDDFTQEERDQIFAAPPKTVWENVSAFKKFPAKRDILLQGDVFTEAVLESYELTILATWTTELANRIIERNMKTVREAVKLHYNDTENVTDLDVVNWEKLNSLRISLMKDSLTNKSLFSQIRDAIEEGNYDLVSELQVKMMDNMNVLNDLYILYKRNLFAL